jgi:hypothetical protein
MIPEIQKFTDNHYITNLYIAPPTDKEINKAHINRTLYNNIDANICEDNVILSMSMSISDVIPAKPSGDVALDTILLPKDYISDMDIDRVPSVEYMFIHKEDNTSLIGNDDINA